MEVPETDDRILQLIEKNSVKTSYGKPFEWFEHGFMIEPLCDFHPRQGVNKCSQVGFSELAILKTFHLVKQFKFNVLYTLPTDDFLQDFVKPKVNKIIENNPVVYGDIRGGIYLKKVGKGVDERFIYFKGAFNPKADNKKEETAKGVSITVDIKIHDESSKSDPFILQQMRSRTDNSDYKGDWWFDNPTYPNVGADPIWLKSDQKHWFIKCHHCNHWQYMDWQRLDQVDYVKGTHYCYVDPIKKEFVCSKCGKVIDNLNRIDGKWVKKFPSRTDFRGYWISKMMYVKHSAKDLLLKEADPKYPTSNFFNFDLGKPYQGSDIQVSRKDILANIDSTPNSLLHNAMGVDQGRIKHYVIGNEQGIFEVGKTESWDDIVRLYQKYHVEAMVIDALPYQRTPKELAEKNPTSIWRAFYQPEADQKGLVKFSPDSDRTIVLIRREEMIDEMVDDVMHGQLPIHIKESELEDYINHFENIYRVVDRDKNGNERFTWLSKTSEDHFVHATVYFRTALMQVGRGAATIVERSRQGANVREPYSDNANELLQKLLGNAT